MFWRFGGYANISTLDSILDKEGVTVEELLDESDLIQELKQQNSKLVEFLRDDAVLHKLLNYVVAGTATEVEPIEDTAAKDNEVKTPNEKADEGPKSPGISFFGKGKARARSQSVRKNDDGETEQERQEAQRKKYAYVACEVLSSEVWSITEAVLEQRDHLREFWQYMRLPAPLDPLQAGYFTKVNEALLDKKTEDMLAFFKSLDGMVPAMVQHVDCPMVMDLLLKIISLEKHEGGQGIVDWLQTQGLIPLLLEFLSSNHSSATQTSAGDFLKAIITISANATTQDQSVIGPNELTRELVSEKCIKSLINEMLQGGNPLTVGVGIIIEVIRKNNSDYDLDNQVGPEPKTSDPIYLGALLRLFAENVPNFMHLIRAPSSKKKDLKVAFGRSIEPLGFDRFKTCELMAELLHCSNMGLLNERGAEVEVTKRDAERERLKAEGKLATPKAPSSPSHDEFGSSVDSHGFHHAERPTDEDMAEREEDRRLEFQNAADEDGFEKVNAPDSVDELPDEVTFDDLNEKIDRSTHGGLPMLERVEKPIPTSFDNISPIDADAMPRPLSPNKPPSPKKTGLHFDPPPTQAAESPTTAGVTDRIETLDVDEDTVMSEFGEEPTNEDDDGPSELERELARSAEKPAPLNFAKKVSSASNDIQVTQTEVAEPEDIGESVATLQGQETATNGERAAYDTEVDGKPVVGDFLKMQFVEHHVVPTILDFFFRFPWNNFLHNVVYDVVQQVFNGTLDRGYNRTVAFTLFDNVQPRDGKSCEDIGLASGKDITDRILDGQKASDESQKNKGMRLGYMGHLTLIAEEVCKFGNRHPPEVLDQHIRDRVNREEWHAYVEGTLADTRDKDNAVLGGVRPENAVGVRAVGGMGGGMGAFSSNTSNTLASAGLGNNGTPQDSLALQEGSVGPSFEINSGASGFGDGSDDDEEMEDEAVIRERERRAAFAEDEQAASTASAEAVQQAEANEATEHFENAEDLEDTEEHDDKVETSSPEGNDSSTGVAPLNIPPSRARRTLARRLAERSHDKNAENDPDGPDSIALETASTLPDEAPEIDLDDATVSPETTTATTGVQISGVRSGGASRAGTSAASRFSGLFRASDDEDSSGSERSFDEDGTGLRDDAMRRGEGEDDDEDEEEDGSRGKTSRPRRQSTTEAKTRKPLDDGDDDDVGLDLARDVEGKMGLGHGSGSGGPFGDLEQEEEGEEVSSDEELIEIKSRRTSAN